MSIQAISRIILLNVSKIFLLCGCLSSCQTAKTASQAAKKVYVDLAAEVVCSFVQEVRQSDGLLLCGYGGGFYDGIDNITLIFASPEAPTIEEARNQFYNISYRMLNRINYNEALRPYLVNYPFTIDNLDLYILYSQGVPGRVSSVTMGASPMKRPNVVYYFGYNTTTGDPETLYKEPYEVGFKIVQNVKIRPARRCYNYLSNDKLLEELLRAEGNAYGANFVTNPEPNEEKK